MLRRKWLELVLGTSAGIIIARDWLVRSLEAKEPPLSQEVAPKTVAAAIKAHKASAVAAFILTYPTVANAATIQEKGTMVYLLGVCPISATAWERTLSARNSWSTSAPPSRSMRGIERRPDDVAVVMRSVGGLPVVQKKLPQLLNPGGSRANEAPSHWT
jgi:hypothetical protein